MLQIDGEQPQVMRTCELSSAHLLLYRSVRADFSPARVGPDSVSGHPRHRPSRTPLLFSRRQQWPVEIEYLWQLEAGSTHPPRRRGGRKERGVRPHRVSGTGALGLRRARLPPRKAPADTCLNGFRGLLLRGIVAPGFRILDVGIDVSVLVSTET